MTKVDSDAWISKAKKRKAYRDHMRDKFFGEVGAKKGAIMQDMKGAPQSQSKAIQKLLDITAKGSTLDSDHKNILKLTTSLLGATGLGDGDKGSTAQTEDLLDKYAMKNLRDNWFWSPAFFD